MSTGFFNTIQMRILGALGILMAIVTLGSYASLNYEKIEFLNPNPATISVSGTGEVLVVPDIGQFSFSVTAEAETASGAQETSGRSVNSILSYLAEQEVAEKDIQVQNYNLSPNWRWETKICPTGSYCPGGERMQDGFTVSQTVRVKVRDTAVAGKIIAGVGERGATNISNLDFMVDDKDQLKAKARALAIVDAQEKAVLLADQLGVRIVRLVSFYENSGGYNNTIYSRTLSLESADMAFGGPELPVGEESAATEVNLVYEVR